MSKSKNVREIEIIYLDKGKEVARGRRYEITEGKVTSVEYKYENPNTGHLVKWKTFHKVMTNIDPLLAQEMHRAYPWSDVDFFKSEDVVYMEISVNPAVVLRREDKFLYRKYMANGYMFYDVLKRDGRLVITTSVVTPDYEDDDAALAKIGAELFDEHLIKVASKHQEALLKAIEIEEFLERKGIPSKYIETRSTTPIMKEPKLRNIQIAIKHDVSEDVLAQAREMAEGYNIVI